MGHGGPLEEKAERVLYFETENGDPDPVRGRDLINKLDDFPRLRLTVLNACESAAVSTDESGEGFETFSGVAGSLVMGGLPAAVAMQLPVSDQAAIAFSRVFYQRLAAGDPVDAAVAEGRQAMHSANAAGFEWATPVLFMRTPNGELYPEKDIRPEQSTWKRWGWRLAAALILLLLLGGAGMAARNWWVERLVDEGVALAQHGQWELARSKFWKAARWAPHSAEVLSNLAGSQEQLGSYPSAEKNYRAAARLEPKSAEHLYNLGRFLNIQGNYHEAFKSLTSAVKRDPNWVNAYGELAAAAQGLNLLDDARKALQTALRIDPSRPALHRRLGEVELRAGNPAAAIEHLNEARRRYPLGERGLVETVSLLVQAYDRFGDRASICREIEEYRRLDRLGTMPWAPPVDEAAERNHCPVKPS
jgi:Tfp pilus assembly protein PilF